MALELALVIATYLNFLGYAIPQNYSTNKTLVIKLTSRAYQAAWGAFSTHLGDNEDKMGVHVSLPALHANVILWRVYLWAGLHLLYLILGLLFVYIQSCCNHPWVENTTMAIFWLNMSTLSLKSNSQVIDPWKPREELPGDMMLFLRDAGESEHLVKTRSRYRSQESLWALYMRMSMADIYQEIWNWNMYMQRPEEISTYQSITFSKGNIWLSNHLYHIFWIICTVITPSLLI